MQFLFVTFLLACLSIWIAGENVFDSWKTGPMVFPCGPSRNHHTGGRKSMIYDCRGTSGDGESGSGKGGGQGGISVVDTVVDDDGMLFIPKENKVNEKPSEISTSSNRLREDPPVGPKDDKPTEPSSPELD